MEITRHQEEERRTRGAQKERTLTSTNERLSEDSRWGRRVDKQTHTETLVDAGWRDRTAGLGSIMWMEGRDRCREARERRNGQKSQSVSETKLETI